MKKLMDWSFLTEQEKFDWVDESSPEGIIQFIDAMKKNQQGIYDRLDRANAEIKLLREQIQKLPYLIGGHQHNERKKDS